MEAGFCINSSVLAEAIRSADTAQLPQFLWAIEQTERRPPFPSRMLLLSKLRRIYDESEPRSRERLHASLALLPVDSTQADYLSDRLLDAQPHEFLVIRDALVRHEGILRDKLWHVVESPEKGKESQRLRAAAALRCECRLPPRCWRLKYPPAKKHRTSRKDEISAKSSGAGRSYRC